MSEQTNGEYCGCQIKKGGLSMCHYVDHTTCKFHDLQSQLAEITLERDQLREQLKRYKPDGVYRLDDADLHRIVNEAPAASEIGWAVKDLLCAHYEIAGLRVELNQLTAKLAKVDRIDQ